METYIMNTLKNWRTRFALVPMAASLTLASGALAETLTYEGFDIPPGELDNESGATSFGWRMEGGEQLTWWTWEQSEPGISLYHGVADEGLTWPGLPTIGNAFVFENEAQQANSVTHRMLPGFLNYFMSGQRWMSALFTPKIDGDPAGGGWFQLCLSGAPQLHASIYLGTSNSSARDQTVWSAGGERLYILNGPNEKDKWSLSEVPVEDGVTVFLVMHLDFDNKTAAWWVNPPVDAEDPGEPVDEFEILTDLYVERVMLRVFNNGPSQLQDEPDFEGQGQGADYTGTRVDEIRIGTTYQSVAAGATVSDPNGPVDEDPPVITGPSGEPGDATATATLVEGTVRVGTMTADEPVSWSISGGPDGGLFTISAGPGGLSLRDLPAFNDPKDADGDNVYVVEVMAEDNAGNTATQTIEVTVIPGWGGIAGEDGMVFLGDNYFGSIAFALAPWIYCVPLGDYLYLPDDHYGEAASWAYFIDFGTVIHGGEGDWYWQQDLQAWCLIPDYQKDGSGWAYVLNGGL
jgi:hypothetical protein